MSIDTATPDAYAAPADQCPACWGANKTPAFIYVAVSGIEYGTAVPGVNVPPPNGLWKVPVDSACVYKLFDPNYVFNYHASLAPSFLDITDGVLIDFFFGIAAGPCERWFQNQFINPAISQYVLGEATIFDFTEDSQSTVQENLALFNIEAKDGTYINIRADTADTAVKIISSHRDNINIAIKENIP